MYSNARRYSASLIVISLVFVGLLVCANGANVPQNNILFDLSTAEGCTVTPLYADGGVIAEADGEFRGVEKLQVAFSANEGMQYAIFVLQGKTAELSESTLRYACQFEGEQTVDRLLYPDRLEAGEYHVVLSSPTGKETLATFSIRTEILKGDVDLDGNITIKDVLLALQALVNGDNAGVPDMNNDGSASLRDILQLMKLCVM